VRRLFRRRQAFGPADVVRCRGSGGCPLRSWRTRSVATSRRSAFASLTQEGCRPGRGRGFAGGAMSFWRCWTAGEAIELGEGGANLVPPARRWRERGSAGGLLTMARRP
jgi:hypothetical protein